jgi:iron(III) transport system substrate-binding protein
MRRIIGAAVAALFAFGMSGGQAAPPEPYQPAPDLIEAAKKEGKVVWYTSTDVAVSEKLAALFEAKYPGIKVQVERAGAERIFQRINQEYANNIHNVDVIETSDAINFVIFKRNGWLLPAVPVDVAQYWPAQTKDADGYYAAYRAHLSIIAYNTKALKPEDAPKSHMDLLDRKWRGRMVKAHPGYSGTLMTDTFALSEALGWSYFEKLGQQKVMQVQSSTEPPKKLAIGERPVMADGNEYNIFILKEAGNPVAPVYATDGTSVVIGNAGILKDAPHPAAAKLLYAFMFTKEAQQANSDVGGLRSFHPDVKEKEGRVPLSQIKLLFTDPARLEPQVEDLKKKYEEYFGT